MVKQHVPLIKIKGLMARKLYIKTFGCQMNEYDSAKMHDVLTESEDIIRVASPEEADILLFNTCSIREKAQEKVFSLLGTWKNWKRDKPNLLICGEEIPEKRLSAVPYATTRIDCAE